MSIRQLPRPASFPLATPRWRRLIRRFTWDWVVVLGTILVYFLLRGQAGGDINFALQVTEDLIELEKRLDIFWEPAIQQASLQWHWVQEFANFVYAYLHFPVLIAVGVWLWVRNRHRFLFMRNVMFISMVFGLLTYYLLPAAPPRLLALHGYDLGFVDTVFGGNTSVSYAQPSLLLNEYAAIPSFHFGWIAMASAVIWVNTRNWALRSVAIVLSLVMGWAIVASANHFFIDMFMGGVVIAISWWLATVLERWQLRRWERRLQTRIS
jgi:hypothetical protein